MLILCAPDAFKGTMSAAEAAAAMRRGALAAGHEAIALPVADGGEGTGEVFVAALGGTVQTAATVDPLRRAIEGWWVELPDGTAVVETAVASGLPLLGAADRDPLGATSEGTGRLIAAAAAAGAARILVAVGGTATVDGGCGMLHAMGVDLLDDTGRRMEAPPPPSAIHAISDMRLNGPLPDLVGLVDTQATLDEAAAVFAPQKGAAPEDIPTLAAALSHLADRLDPDGTIRRAPGTGAGGGIGFSIAALGGELRSGAHTVLEHLDFAAHLRRADLVITGEGCLDGQTATGKAPLAVAQAARDARVPCIAIAGILGDGAEQLIKTGIFSDVVSMLDHLPIEEAMGDPQAALQQVTRMSIVDGR